jgi:hypothetical protein
LFAKTVLCSIVNISLPYQNLVSNIEINQDASATYQDMTKL